MNIQPIQEVGSGKKATLYASYNEVNSVLGADNVTDMDDSDKVSASWGFQDADTGRKAFIWFYRDSIAPLKMRKDLSVSGDLTLIEDLFPGKLEKP